LTHNRLRSGTALFLSSFLLVVPDHVRLKLLGLSLARERASRGGPYQTTPAKLGLGVKKTCGGSVFLIDADVGTFTTAFQDLYPRAMRLRGGC
jgi:hypothetical protein